MHSQIQIQSSIRYELEIAWTQIHNYHLRELVVFICPVSIQIQTRISHTQF